MPANLPPPYYDLERKIREATSSSEKTALYEEMMSVIPKHKGTDKLRAEIRKKISKLKTSPQSKKGGTRKESIFNINREGAAQILVVGPTNVGKSSIVSALTNATPTISDAPHTTWTPLPGMMNIDDIQVQLIDTPPLNREYVDKDLYDLARRANMIFLVVDVQSDPFSQLEECATLFEENKIAPIRLKETYQHIPRMTFLPFHVLANKVDNDRYDENIEIFEELLEDAWPYIPISATKARNLNHLKAIVIERLEIIRVYSKTPGKPADLSAPFTLRKGDTVQEFAAKVHKDIAKNMKNARIWGENVHDGQLVQRDHVLEDGDIVEVHI